MMKCIFRRLLYLNASALLFCSAISLWGCGSGSEVEENESDRETIISYLESSHSPSLIAESDVSASLTTNPEFYTEYGDFAFRYIDDYYNVARDAKSQIESGSTVLINFRLYSFTGSSISDSDLPVYTNEAKYESLYIEAGLNPVLWTFSPMEITIGKTSFIAGLSDGLIGCKEGDVVELYMTRNMAYGSDVIGLIDQYASLAFYCTVLSVTK